MGLFRPARVDPADARALVDRKLSWILDGCAPGEVWLFGSAARGELTEASDIDIALVFDSESEIDEARRSLYSRPRPDLWPQDLVFYQRDELYGRAATGGLPMLIVKEGVKLYPGEGAP